MDLIFEQFEKWFKEREPIWNKNSITIEKIHLETEYGHHYSMNLKCDNGLGNIVLYESNGIYWFMLEAGNYYDDGMFIRDDVRFENIKDINHLVDEMLNYMVQ